MKDFLDRDIIVIDVESNGLYGQPFCVGAVLMDQGGRVLGEFLGRCGIDEVEDEWVLENVIPVLQINENYPSLTALEEGFLQWFVGVHRADQPKPHVLVDVSFPVDGGFLYRLGLRGDDYGKMWRDLSPYPLYDLASIFAGLGIDPDINRLEFAGPLIGTAKGAKHHPLWDAEVSGLCLIRAMRSKGAER